MQVLIVEDDARLAKLLEQGLREEGCQTALAATGPEGLAAVRTGEFEVILLDVMLPGLDGFRVARELRLSVSESYCQVEVADGGPGIAPGDLPHIFDRFYRADSARTPGAGVGLGLSIARSVVDSHGGEIEALPVDRGAAFRVTLPLTVSRTSEPTHLSANE